MNIKTMLALCVSLMGFSAIGAADTLRVIDDNNRPVANATILLGFEAGNPFPGNILRTGADGAAGVPTDWKAALPVTVQAPGFIASTLPVLMPGDHRIQISRQESANLLEIKGETTNFGRLITDGKVDFGLVMPALSRESMLAFDLGSVISPQMDTIEIIGNSVEVPSNLTLPLQEESYIFPITFDKPGYRAYVREPGQYQMYVMHGQFPLRKVVDDIRGGKSMFEVINYFNFIEAGQKNISVSGNIDKVDLSVNQTPFNSAIAVKAPAFPAGKAMVGLALAEKGGLFVPTDLKRFTPNQAINLKSNASLGTTGVLSLLMDQPKSNAPTRFDAALAMLSPVDAMSLVAAETTEDPESADYNFNKLTFVFSPVSGTVTPQFLPMVDKPQLTGNTMKLQVPALSAGLAPAAMFLVMSEIEEIGSGKTKTERRTRLWEVWSPGWMAQVEMPKIAFTKKPNRKYRWEVLFLARPTSFAFETSPTDRVDLNTVTHVTRNAMDF